MKLLITGATGYIGGQLAARFLRQGHDLSVIARPGSDVSKLAGAQIHYYDGSLGSLSRALESSGAQQVHHLASLYLSRHTPDDIDRLVAANLLFPTQLLEAMAQADVRQFINVGTGWQHHEDAAFNPVNLYAASKQAFEDLLEYYVQGAGFSAVTLKILDSIGPGDPRPKVVSLLRNAVRTGVPLRMSPGGQTLDFVYIEDILDAFTLASQRVGKEKVSEIFGLGSGNPVTLHAFVELYQGIVGHPVPVQWSALPYREREVMHSWQDYEVLPGWRPQTSLAESIRLTESAPGGLIGPAP